MKLIDYDKHRAELQKKIRAFSFDSRLTCRETTEKIMELLDSLPAEYTEEDVAEIDQAYQRVCRELEATQHEMAAQGAVIYTAYHRIIMGRIDQIQAILLQHPAASHSLYGRLDELHMTLAECGKLQQEYLKEYNAMYNR